MPATVLRRWTVLMPSLLAMAWHSYAEDRKTPLPDFRKIWTEVHAPDDPYGEARHGVMIHHAGLWCMVDAKDLESRGYAPLAANPRNPLFCRYPAFRNADENIPLFVFDLDAMRKETRPYPTPKEPDRKQGFLVFPTVRLSPYYIAKLHDASQSTGIHIRILRNDGGAVQDGVVHAKLDCAWYSSGAMARYYDALGVSDPSLRMVEAHPPTTMDSTPPQSSDQAYPNPPAPLIPTERAAAIQAGLQESAEGLGTMRARTRKK